MSNNVEPYFINPAAATAFSEPPEPAFPDPLKGLASLPLLERAPANALTGRVIVPDPTETDDLLSSLLLSGPIDQPSSARMKPSSADEPKASHHFKIYDEASSQDAVRSFVYDLTAIPKEDLIIKNVEPGLTSGASGAPVLLVFNQKTNELISVIKENNDIIASKEISALNLLNTLPLQHAQFPRVMGIGLHHGKILVAQSPARGESLAAYMVEAGALPEGRSKNLALFKLTKSVQTTAIGLAEFHNTTKISESDHVSDGKEKVVTHYKTRLQQNLDFLTHQNTLSKSQAQSLNLKTNNALFKGVGSYVHYDFHPGNIFYDQDSEIITIIDNDGMLDSLDPSSGLPRGVAAYDVAYFIQWLAILGQMNHLNADEITDLQMSFSKTYAKYSANKSLEEELEFMQVYVLSDYIVQLEDALGMPGHPWIATLGSHTVRYLIAHLQTCLLREC